MNTDSGNGKLLKEFCDIYNLHNIIKVPTCYKSSNPTLIDVILCNQTRKHLKTGAFDCGLSDFHHMIYTVFKSHAQNDEIRTIRYRSFKHFNEELFKNDLENAPFGSVCDLFESAEDSFVAFTELFSEIVNNHLPLKTKK